MDYEEYCENLSDDRFECGHDIDEGDLADCNDECQDRLDDMEYSVDWEVK